MNNLTRKALAGVIAVFMLCPVSVIAKESQDISIEDETEMDEAAKEDLLCQVAVEVTQCRYEKKKAMESVLYFLKTELSNHSDREIMEIKTGVKFYDEQKNEIFSGWGIYNGQDTPIAPGGTATLEMSGRIEYPEEPSFCETTVLEVYTAEEKPPIHIPQKGELLYLELAEPHMTEITTKLPIQINLWIDCGGEISEAEIKDAETIAEIVDAFSAVRIGDETEESVTDNYNGMLFTFEDGTEIPISLNLKNLEYRVYNGIRIYELENFDTFWTLMNDLTDDAGE